jgi:hypothetical protein
MQQLAMLLACFDGHKSAARSRRAIDAALRSRGDNLLDTVIGEVNAKHAARVYDPRRVVAGALIPAVTWGIFGALTGGGLAGAVASGLLGALLGGMWGYIGEHVWTRAQLTRLGACVQPETSAILSFVATSDPAGLLDVATAHAARVASVVAIREDLSARVFARDPEPAASQEATMQHSAAQPVLSLLSTRYPDPATAGRVANRIASTAKSTPSAPQIELVLRTDSNGDEHVTDPGHGSGFMARSNIVSWGGFGLIFGALAGVTGGGGILGLLSNAVLTGVAWGLFGLIAGVLYGHFAGQAVTAGSLKGLRGLLVPGSSMLLAWTEGPALKASTDLLVAPGSQLLILGFTPIEGGSVLVAPPI